MSALAALAEAAGGHAHETTDAVGGVPARWVVSPGSTDEVAAVLRAAAAHDLAVVARGGGTKLDWGLPPRRVDVILDLRRLDQVVEHAAGDLVAIAQAGVPLAALADRLRQERQRLAIDEVVPGSTVGGVLATGLTGPRRLAAGAVRDLVLGVTLVRADGVVAKAGGKVVKNVAGYDLAKLVTGAYGTLGVVTEAAFRLHPIAEASAYVRVGPVEEVLPARWVPAAFELDRPPGGPAELVALIEGTAAGVADRVARAGPEVPEPAWWGRLPEGDVLLKVTAELTGIGALLSAVGDAGHVRGSAGVGSFHVGLPAADAAAVVGRLRAASTGTVVVLAAPPEVRSEVDSWGPVPGLELMRRVKDRFDPGARLAPGRFVGGI